MKIRVLISILLFFIFFTCGNSKGGIDKFENSGISVILNNEIQKFIALNDSVNQKFKVISVVFESSKTDCLINLICTKYYSEQNLIGNVVQKDLLITFHDMGSSCINKYVDKQKLTKAIPEKFKNPEHMSPNEPYSRMLKAVENNRFEIIFEGYK